jgi:hypothetical protein
MRKISPRHFIAALFVLIFSTTLVSAQNRSLVQFGRTIRVESGQPVADVTCIMCSVFLRGPATGDITALGGSITIESGVPASGDVTAIGGDIRIQAGAAIAGDVTAIGGAIRRASDSQIGGDVTSMEGKGWLLLIFVVPFLIFGLFVALVVWLVRYLFRSPTTAPGPMGPTMNQHSTGL